MRSRLWVHWETHRQQVSDGTNDTARQVLAIQKPEKQSWSVAHPNRQFYANSDLLPPKDNPRKRKKLKKVKLHYSALRNALMDEGERGM